MSKYLDNNGLLYLWNSKIKPLFEKALPKSGGTMTGPLMLHGEPSSDLEAASKKYVDDSRKNDSGDMLKSVYDTNGNGIVDNAEKVGGFTVGVSVPADAKFTDTTYTNATSSQNGLMSKEDYSKLAAFGQASDYALKSEISTAYKYEVGDVWNVEDTGMNYAWTGEEWDALGQVFEIQAITNGEIDSITDEA